MTFEAERQHSAEVEARYQELRNVKVNMLDVLDMIDALRRKYEYAEHQNNDYVLRVACGIVAALGGVQSRVDWCDALEGKTDSKYAAYLRGEER